MRVEPSSTPEANPRVVWASGISTEIRRRVQLASRVGQTEQARALTLRAIGSQEHGLELFLRDWVWTHDPRNKGSQPKDQPFFLWPRQVEALRWVKALEDDGQAGALDKSRDVGVTWLVAAYMVWRWLTVPGWAGTVGSRKAEVLDRSDDPKTVFWKLEFIVRMLPDWMRPKGFSLRKHRTFARLINPRNRAVITGEAGPEMGRGGRSSFYFLDEFGFMPRAQQVRAAVADNASSILYISTATSPGTEFYRLVHEENIPHFRLSWKDDPRKNAAWREDYIRQHGPSIAAREVDIDYSGGGDDLVIPADWIRAAVELDLSDASDRTVTGGMDVADSGDNETVYVERTGPTVTRLLAWKGRNPVDSASLVADAASGSGVGVIRYDSIGVGAGVTGLFNALEERPFHHTAVNTGLPPSKTYYPDAPERRADERFLNLKAELWWALRLRFWNSWRYLQGQDIDPDDCISIPDDARLISQLSMPKTESNEKGRLKIESKASLKRRGMSSPDRADALVMAFAPRSAFANEATFAARVYGSDLKSANPASSDANRRPVVVRNGKDFRSRR
jgi:phage terminase large subunit